ncbi:hypothetical protein [Hymenobacter sp. B81]|uniref:hypothetical protein n=1 Tax=Hymenobacter sp. B81 TaxID=3344878 RepID=UPI0037DCC33A
MLIDNGYGGCFARHKAKLRVQHEWASRSRSSKGFVPVARRWVKERTLQWLTSFAASPSITSTRQPRVLAGVANSMFYLNRQPYFRVDAD